MMALYAKALFADIRSYREPMEQAVDEVIRPRIRENFRSESAAGDKWQPLAQNTRQQRQRLGFAPAGPMLRRTDALYKTAQQKNIWTFSRRRAQIDEAALESRVSYALYHQEGTLEMPARPYLVITEEDADKIERIFADYAVRREIAAAAGIRWATARRFI